MRPSTVRLRRALLDLAPAIYREHVPLRDFRMLVIGANVSPAELPIPQVDAPGWRNVAIGSRWGGRDQNAWFHATAEVPAHWRARSADEARVTLRLLLGRGSDEFFGWPEGLLYVNRRLCQGINRHHPDVLLRGEDVSSGQVELDVRAWSGMLASDHLIEEAEIALLSRDCEAFTHLLSAGVDLVDALSAGDPLAYALAAVLEDAYDRVDMRGSGPGGTLETSVGEALALLDERLAELRGRFDAASRPTVTAVGHGHLDVAWLWQTHHTREKTARTFSIATTLMEQYPDYVFLHTTPQVFAWLKRDYPEIYARVRDRVAEGRFEAAGAMWVESDCNLVSGESLVRQILYGQRFLSEEFGREYDALWLPDAFGYSAALPQILLRAGIPVFMTTKLSWSDTNRIPADTFRWRGIDGSEVIAHFLTTPALHHAPPLDRVDTYNGLMSVTALRGAYERYRQKDVADEVLLAFGHGDGGAGATRQQLEHERALKKLPGLPRLRLGRADEYFERLRRRVWDAPALPVWDGELYLEYHRGTYTSQAWLKRAHRQNEARLLLAEALDAWQWQVHGDAAPDRGPLLDDAWRALLLHEFHDILPGSSIGPVYDDARRAMAEIAEAADGMIDEALDTLSARVEAPTGGLLVVNGSPCERDALLELDATDDVRARVGRLRDTAGRLVTTQTTSLGAGEKLLLEAGILSGLSCRVLPLGEVGESKSDDEHAVDGHVPALGASGVLENSFFRVAVNGRGEVTSLVDKRVPGGRELLLAGEVGNRFEAFEDRPQHFDAWDIDATYERKAYLLNEARVELVEAGPLRATLHVVRTFRSSTIEQHISLYRSLPRIDFATRVNWHEHHVLLKVAFPFDLRAQRATHEIQYGALERPTHRNTSWEQARFETAAHRWVDVSEADYGVSLLNDGRYGHDVRDATVRLTLLRSATYPDPDADQGEHVVTYSVYPHLGDWRAGGTVAAAYALNRPTLTRWLPATGRRGAERQALTSLFTAEPGQVVLEAVKRPAEGDGLIVRVYEARGSRRTARVRSACDIARVEECDLLERTLNAGASRAYELWRASPVASHDAPVVDGAAWTFELRPFEVRTFRVLFA
jgi:alpha-mannosidase